MTPTTLLLISGTFSLVALLLSYKSLSQRYLFNHKNLVFLARLFYNHFYSVKGNYLKVNNYGFAPIDDDVTAYEPLTQCGIQLYKEAVRNHSGYIALENLTIVEVGCGKSGGADFLINNFNPQKYIGIDYSKKAIDLARRDFSQTEKACFICADAHQLPLSDNIADVVINIESSHIYKNQIKFFAEVNRVLKNKCTFILCDFRYLKYHSLELLENDLVSNGFEIAQKRIITPHIYQSCVLLSELRKEMINEVCPWYLKKYIAHYSALNGTKKSEMFNNGEIVYFIYHLTKI